MIYSSSGIYAYEKFGDSAFFVKRHLIFLAIGFALMFSAMLVSMEAVERFARPIMAISIFLLAAVLIPGIGYAAGGARRWFRIGAFSFQPAELAKFSLIIYLAALASKKGYRVKDLVYGYLPLIGITGFTVILILLEPDLGTAVSLFFVGFLMIFIAGGRLSHLAATVLIGLPFLWYLVFSVPYRRRRLFAFLDPWQDMKGAGFQIVQSFLALGSGGLLGVGLGQSRQKLFYLPESHTDFIFSIIGEELGLAGAASVVLLFAVFAWQGMRAGFRTGLPFNKLLIFGITGMIAFEAIINIGVSVGAFPTKGLPLPFISYGGSSLILHMGAVGLMLNAMRE